MIKELNENTNRKVIADVINGVKELNADSKLSKRKVYSTLFRKAKKLIDRDIRDRKLFKNADSFDTICLEFESVPLNKCACKIDLNPDCTIMRSVEKVPKIFNSVNGPAVYYITTMLGNKEIKLTTPASAAVKSKIKGVSTIYAFIENEYMYTISDIEMLSITALFEDDVTKYKCGYVEEKESLLDCDGWLNKKTFIPDRLIDDTVLMTINELTQSFSKLNVDTLNNNNPNIETK